MKNIIHEPVLLDEVIDAFGGAHLKNGRYIDATLGYAGHTLEILKNGGSVLGIEYDTRMLSLARERIKSACSSQLLNKMGLFKFALGNFENIKAISKENGFDSADGILFDLGVSSYQLTNPDLGFSYSNLNSDLDMRADSKLGIRACDLLNILRRDQLTELFARTLSRSSSARIADLVIKYRQVKNFVKVGDLVEIAKRVVNINKKPNPLAKVFLALRMAVNSEIENLEKALPDAFSLLDKEGKLLVITFHSTEDKLVKDYFNHMVSRGLAEKLFLKPITPSESEKIKNPRSRSAKLRGITKIK